MLPDVYRRRLIQRFRGTGRKEGTTERQDRQILALRNRFTTTLWEWNDVIGLRME